MAAAISSDEYEDTEETIYSESSDLSNSVYRDSEESDNFDRCSERAQKTESILEDFSQTLFNIVKQKHFTNMIKGELEKANDLSENEKIGKLQSVLSSERAVLEKLLDDAIVLYRDNTGSKWPPMDPNIFEKTIYNRCDYDLSPKEKGQLENLEKGKSKYTIARNLYSSNESFLSYNYKSSLEIDESEQLGINVYQRELCKMVEKENTYKILLCEVQEQINGYQEKYLLTQRELERHKHLLQDQKMYSAKADEKCKSLVSFIRTKFQENHAIFKEKLDIKRKSLQHCEEEKELLTKKLRAICREYKLLRDFLESHRDKLNPKPLPQIDEHGLCDNCRQLQTELSNLMVKYENLSKEGSIYNSKNRQLVKELENVKSEFSRTISNLNERTRLSKSALNEQIDKLECNLAQCSQKACISISLREDVIQKLQDQMKHLSTNYMTAQKELNYLKNQLMAFNGRE